MAGETIEVILRESLLKDNESVDGLVDRLNAALELALGEAGLDFELVVAESFLIGGDEHLRLLAKQPITDFDFSLEENTSLLVSAALDVQNPPRRRATRSTTRGWRSPR